MDKSFTNLLLRLNILLFLSFLISCVPQNPATGRKSSTGQITTNPNGPSDINFEQEKNFIQSAGQTILTTLGLPPTFKDTFIIRGKDLHQYLKTNTTNIQHLCLVSYFPNATSNNILILPAIKKVNLNTKINTQEFFLQVQSIDNSSNRGLCNTQAINNTLSNKYPGSLIEYSVSSFCLNCQQDLIGQGMQIFTSEGISLPVIEVNHLNLKISLQIPTSNVGGGQCTTSSECQARSYDCCSSGQCIKDRTIKSGVDLNGQDYLQAVNDLANGGSYFDYPNLFNLCTNSVSPTPTATATPNAIATATAIREELKELYECTTITKNEKATCTKTYDSAQSLISQSTTFISGADDRNFNNTYSGTSVNFDLNSIEKVTYAGLTLFSNATALTGLTLLTPGNDNLSDGQTFNITASHPSNAPNDQIKIRYKTDGSCIKINNSLAKCKKFYVQGQNTGEIDDHFPGTAIFRIPPLADLTRSLVVTVDGIIKKKNLDWNLITSPNSVEFDASSDVLDGQEVTIEYYVDLNVNPILQSKQTALEKIKTYCGCADTTCTLAPFTTAGFTDYVCVYPTPTTPDQPLQVRVNVSTKAAPVKYFDVVGLHHESLNGNIQKQEGTEFLYTANNPLAPNNIDNYIGFNEIYGNISISVSNARAPTVVHVQRGKTYDLFTEQGVFSSCLNCGTDYYSTLARIFPDNFFYVGGGYRPDLTRTDRFKTTNLQSVDFRSDDLLFGRACFVPATMIPWTHKANNDLAQQRKLRQKSQHFLFANGYQRDWYGFDYGALIGSFDGLSWFAIGNQRNIKATSNRLYIAVNAYFNDRTIENNFTVAVTESSLSLPGEGSAITRDIDNDGAQCQLSHLCEVDQDCATQLGWDYSCEAISDLKTSWPLFDENGGEIRNSNQSKKLIELIHGGVGVGKRCVYRGRGSLCHKNYNQTNKDVTYSGTNKNRMHACSMNNYCQEFSSVSTGNVSAFNNKIARFASSPLTQNLSGQLDASLEEDTFGLAARFIGRPFYFRGNEEVDVEIRSQLLTNNATSICIPGRNASATTFVAGHQDSSADMGDPVHNIGSTPSSTSTAALNYLSSCSIFDSLGNYYHANNPTTLLNTPDLYWRAGTQTMSTNLLKALEIDDVELVTDFSNQVVEEIQNHQNACMRAPGSACFSDFDCAPNKFIADKLELLDDDSVIGNANINSNELQYWKEYLVCGQAASKDSADFDLRNNRCCRENGNTITIGTDFGQQANLFTDDSLAGLNFAINGSPNSRNSRTAPAYFNMKNSGTSYPHLITSPADACTGGGGCMSVVDASTSVFTTFKRSQFKTIDDIATKTCCSGNWIRQFSNATTDGYDRDNGGGNVWTANKHQTIDKTSFKCLNWIPNATDPFSCTNPDDLTCNIRNIGQTEQDDYLNFLGTLELTGIPNVIIKGYTGAGASINNSPYCKAPGAGTSVPVLNDVTTIIPNTLSGDAAEYLNGSNNINYFSASDEDNFETDIKMVFSKDKINCCVPTGVQVDSSVPSSRCCTGVKFQNRCCLNDYTNLSVYFNRFVSSEASHLPDSYFDLETGFLKSSSVVEQLAIEKNVCCSGTIARGVAISNLKIPGNTLGDEDTTVTRWLESDDGETDNYNGKATLYDQGLKWNHHVYCVPESLSDN